MSLAEQIRRLTGGQNAARLAGEQPEDAAEDQMPEDQAADDQPEDEAAEDQPEDQAADDQPEDEAEGEQPEEDEPAMSAPERRAFARGFAAANARAAAILGARGADANPALAAELAFAQTGLSAAAAVAILGKAGPGKGRLASAMAEKGARPLGSGGGTSASLPAEQPARLAQVAKSMTAAKRR